ncbi:hypothetical protein PR001_g25685 [Phytophthora rubi]|uniref:ZSWIM1/3 RNaseH-like domain-containing protein n=1 Tax=Phytophthora rubi TaxID=129364 RepID=A0A6A3I5C1_9STRA|nr:hypothetical protein PR001_g25685 [Phytophthora rubi]
MARTHKTASTKAQMAEQARKEEEARHQVAAARTRSQKSAALACARESRADFKEEEAADEVTEEEAEGFPEVLQMDCSHQTNHKYSLVETNGDWHMSKCLDHFKRANEHWRFARIVIDDRDLREFAVIRRTLPEVRIMYCHFHVIKWLHDIIRKSKRFGVYPDDVLTQMAHTITNRTYARTQEDYEMHCAGFKSLAERDGRTELWEYFDKN